MSMTSSKQDLYKTTKLYISCHNRYGASCNSIWLYMNSGNGGIFIIRAYPYKLYADKLKIYTILPKSNGGKTSVSKFFLH